MFARRPGLAAFMALAAVLFPGARARAEDFRVRAQVYCLAHLKEHRFDPTFTAPLSLVPCIGTKVVALDARSGHDAYCGSAFTDTSGKVDFAAHCSRFLGFAGLDKPQVYLSVEARTDEGLEVASFDPKTERNRVFRWITRPLEAADEMALNFGRITLGGGSPGSLFAAETLWAGNTTLRALAETGYSPGRWTILIDHPYFGSPTTLWKTTYIDATRAPRDKAAYLSRLARELIHAAYDTYHSGWSHWLADAKERGPSPSACEPSTDASAWYDGFAEFGADWLAESFHASEQSWRACARGSTPVSSSGAVHDFLLRLARDSVSLEDAPGEKSPASGAAKRGARIVASVFRSPDVEHTLAAYWHSQQALWCAGAPSLCASSSLDASLAQAGLPSPSAPRAPAAAFPSASQGEHR